MKLHNKSLFASVTSPAIMGVEGEDVSPSTMAEGDVTPEDSEEARIARGVRRELDRRSNVKKTQNAKKAETASAQKKVDAFNTLLEEHRYYKSEFTFLKAREQARRDSNARMVKGIKEYAPVVAAAVAIAVGLTQLFKKN